MEEKLIEAIRAQPCLYNKSSHLFRNRPLKEKAWISVANAVGVPEKQCQVRWKSLRDRFVRERKLLKEKSGAVAEDESNWHLMNAMEFLTDHVSLRKTAFNMDFSWSGEQASCSNDNETAGSFDPLIWSSPECSQNTTNNEDKPSSSFSRKRKAQKEDEANEAFGTLCSTVNQFISSKSDSFNNSRNYDFYKVLDGYLLKHSEEEQDEMKMYIMQYVFDKKKK